MHSSRSGKSKSLSLSFFFRACRLSDHANLFLYIQDICLKGIYTPPPNSHLLPCFLALSGSGWKLGEEAISAFRWASYSEPSKENRILQGPEGSFSNGIQILPPVRSKVNDLTFLSLFSYLRQEIIIIGYLLGSLRKWNKRMPINHLSWHTACTHGSELFIIMAMITLQLICVDRLWKINLLSLLGPPP